MNRLSEMSRARRWTTVSRLAEHPRAHLTVTVAPMATLLMTSFEKRVHLRPALCAKLMNGVSRAGGGGVDAGPEPPPPSGGDCLSGGSPIGPSETQGPDAGGAVPLTL